MSRSSSETVEPGSPNANSRGIAMKRVSVRERKFIKFGQRIAKLRIGRTKKIFTIHEELICAHSPYFRTKLQSKRKPIKEDCPVCHEEMLPTKKEITFCRFGCGANMHHDCMEKWIEQKLVASETANCPLCRKSWSRGAEIFTTVWLKLNAQAFEVYQKWLYHGHIALAMDEAQMLTDLGEDDTDHAFLFQAYLLGVKVQDKLFCRAVLQALTEVFQETVTIPSPGNIRTIYEITTEPSHVRKFLVEVFVKQADLSWLEDDDYHIYPPAFMRDLARALFAKHTVREDIVKDMEDVRSKYCAIDEHEEGELKSDAFESDGGEDS